MRNTKYLVKHTNKKKKKKFYQALSFALRWHLSPTQMKCTCNVIDSTYIFYGVLNQNSGDLRSCLMAMKTFFFLNLISFLVKKIFERSQCKNVMLPVPTQPNAPGGIKAYYTQKQSPGISSVPCLFNNIKRILISP